VPYTLVKEFRELFAPAISMRVRELAKELDDIYGVDPSVAVCVLRGAFMFFGDVVRSLQNKKLEVDFVRLSSYTDSSTNSGWKTLLTAGARKLR
jgi:hypoxanthine phosphoribosyltransferase